MPQKYILEKITKQTDYRLSIRIVSKSYIMNFEIYTNINGP